MEQQNEFDKKKSMSHSISFICGRNMSHMAEFSMEWILPDLMGAVNWEISHQFVASVLWT